MIIELENKEKSRGEIQGNGVDMNKYQELVQMIQQKQMEIQGLQQDFQKGNNNQEIINHY